MKQYSYKGPVLEFEKIIANNWEASTWAVSPSKARSNLAFRFKKEHDKLCSTKITLPGKLIVMEGKDDN